MARHTKGGMLFGKPRGKVVKRPGAFKAKAKRAGMSTKAYAKKEAGAPGRLGKEARLAETFAKMRSKKKRGAKRRGYTRR